MIQRRMNPEFRCPACGKEQLLNPKVGHYRVWCAGCGNAAEAIVFAAPSEYRARVLPKTPRRFES